MIGLLRNLFARQRQTEAGRRGVYDWDLSPDDRIGALPKRSRRRKLVRWSVLLAGVGGVGYATYQDPTIVTRSWELASPLVSKMTAAADLGRASRPSFPPPPKLTEAPLPPQPEQRSPADAPQRLAAPATTPLPATATSPSQPDKLVEVPARVVPAHPAPSAQASIPYAPPAKVTVDDPYEVKAKAAGLHPDLSRALLAELTDADYRNARIATETALARTPDDGVYRWPRKREAGLAVFEVRFVPGAPDTCRRYIVTIEKNRWLTTSLPVDKCGTGPIRRHAAAGAR